MSAPLANRPYFGFCSSFEKTTKRVRCRYVFFPSRVTFAPLLSLPPSPISGPGSHCRLFAPPGGAGLYEILMTKRHKTVYRLVTAPQGGTQKYTLAFAYDSPR